MNQRQQGIGGQTINVETRRDEGTLRRPRKVGAKVDRNKRLYETQSARLGDSVIKIQVGSFIGMASVGRDKQAATG